MRTDVSISLAAEDLRAVQLLAQIHAEGVSCLASRTTCAPSQVARASKRGCPRLPRPAMRDLEFIIHGAEAAWSGVQASAHLGEACPYIADTRRIFSQKTHWIAQLAEGQQAQPPVVFGENEWAAALCQAIAIALLDGFACFLACQRKVLFLDGQICAGQQPNQVRGIRRGPRFVEIVHAPDQPAFQVAPGAEILDVQIAHGQDLRRAGKFRADHRPPLRPAVKRGAQKGKCGEGHVAVLQLDVGRNQLDMPRRPFFEVGGGVNDIGEILFLRP